MRFILDATHGVLTNYAIRVRDHTRCPAAADITAWLCEQAHEGGSLFALVYDVAQAHARCQSSLLTGDDLRVRWKARQLLLRGRFAKPTTRAAASDHAPDSSPPLMSSVRCAPPREMVMCSPG